MKLQTSHDYDVNGFKASYPIDIPLFKIGNEKNVIKLEMRIRVDPQDLNDVLSAIVNDLPRVHRLYVANENDMFYVYVIAETNSLSNVEELTGKFFEKYRTADLNVTIKRGGEDIVCFSEGFPLTVDGHRVIVVLKELFEELSDHFVRYLGSGGAALLWHLGKRWGEVFVVKLSSRLTTPSSTVKRLRLLLEILRATGWGVFTLDSVDAIQYKGSVTVRESCELKSHDGCHFIRGLLAGILSEVFGVNMNVREIVHNDNRKCNFIFYCNNRIL